MKLARVLITAAAVCAAAAIPAQAAMAAPEQAAAGQASSQAGFKLPYTDTNQDGWLTLCGVNLKPVTHGSIYAKPFVWRVVSSVPAQEIYWKHGAKESMYVYQPREQTPPGAWSGVLMATPSIFSNRLDPMAQFTPIDQPLSYVTEDIPPMLDHLYEIRLYIGAPGMQEDVLGYPAADIQVIGNTWQLVAGGHSSCTSGKAVSEETITGMPGARGTPTPQAGAAKEGTTSPSKGASGSSTATSGRSGSGGTGSADAADVSHTSIAVPLAAGLGGAAVLIVAGLASAAFWRRRRRALG
jgi:hypothetical protein